MAISPDAQQQVSVKLTPDTLVAATAKMVVAANSGRKYLLIQNTGTNPLSISFGSNPTAGQGLTLDGASGAAGQGGVAEFIDVIPTDAVHAISTAGTTMIVMEGG